MSASSDYLRVLTDITQQQGATAAATQRANSAIWGNTVAKLGEFAPEAIKQYGIDKKAKKQEQDDENLRKLFTTASQEFQAQQSAAQMGNATGQPGQTMNADGTPMVGPELAGARPPRSSPFPSPGEILSAVGPVRGIPIVNGIAALHQAPTQDPEKNLARLQMVYKGLAAMPEDQRAEALPHIVDLFEKQGVLPAGQVSKQYDPETFKAIGATLKVEPPIKVSKDEVLLDPVTHQPIFSNMVSDKPKTKEEILFDSLDPNSKTKDISAAAWQKQVDEANQAIANKPLTPYEKVEAANRDRDFKLAQQRFELAVKNSNKPATVQGASDLVDAVIAHPELYAQLTPSTKDKITGELSRRGFEDFKKPPSATLENRLSSAKAVVQTGNDMIAQIKKISGELGPIMGRYNSVADFVGDPPPGYAKLAGLIESYSLANMGVHGMRSSSGAEAINHTLGVGRHTPQSMIETIEGLNGFANHLMENEGRGVTAPPPPAGTGPGLSYQDYLKSKGGK